MLFGFRGYCLDCGHQRDWLRSRIACGHIDFQKPETYRWYFCQRCFLDLLVPRSTQSQLLAALGLRKCFSELYPLAAQTSKRASWASGSIGRRLR